MPAQLRQSVKAQLDAPAKPQTPTAKKSPKKAKSTPVKTPQSKQQTPLQKKRTASGFATPEKGNKKGKADIDSNEMTGGVVSVLATLALGEPR